MAISVKPLSGLSPLSLLLLLFLSYLAHKPELRERVFLPARKLSDLPAPAESTPSSENVTPTPAPFRRSGSRSAISTAPDGAPPRRSASPLEMQLASSTSAPAPLRSSWPPSPSPEPPRSTSLVIPSTDAANFTSATDGALPALAPRARRSWLRSPSPELPRSEAEKSSTEAAAATAPVGALPRARRLAPAPDRETALNFSTYISMLSPVVPAPGTDQTFLPKHHLMPICKCVCAPCPCVPCKAVAPPVCNCNCLFPLSPTPAPSPDVHPKKKKEHWYLHWYIDLMLAVGLYLVGITLVRIFFGPERFKTWEKWLSNVRKWTMRNTDSEAPQPKPKSKLRLGFEDLLRHYRGVIYYVGSTLLIIALVQYFFSPIVDYYKGGKVHEPELEVINILVVTFRYLLQS